MVRSGLLGAYNQPYILLFNDPQVHGETGLGIESVVLLSLVHVESDPHGPSTFLEAEGPRIVATVSGEEVVVELYIKRDQWMAGCSVWKARLTASPVTSAFG